MNITPSPATGWMKSSARFGMHFSKSWRRQRRERSREAEKNAQSGKEEAPPALPTSPVRAEGEAANAAVSAGEQKADWKVIVLAVIVAFCGGVSAGFLSACRLLPECYKAEQYVRQGKQLCARRAYYDDSQDTAAAAAKRMVKGQAQLYEFGL